LPLRIDTPGTGRRNRVPNAETATGSVKGCGKECNVAKQQILTYRDLDVWNVAMDLVVEMYSLVDLLPSSERYELSSQMRRSATCHASWQNAPPSAALVAWTTDHRAWSIGIAASGDRSRPRARVPVNYRATELPSYRTTELPNYRATELPSYRATELPNYRATELPNYRTGPSMRAPMHAERGDRNRLIGGAAAGRRPRACRAGSSAPS
jgi:hypothetical protein